MSVYEDRLKEIAQDAVTAAAWDPLLHPRARNGEFIKVGGWVRGLFKIGSGEIVNLSGRVTRVEKNKRYPKDPLVKVMTKHGEVSAPISQISEAAEPKGTLEKIVSKVLPWVDEDPKATAYMQMSLDGDVTFDPGMSLEGRVLNGVTLAETDFNASLVVDVDVNEPPLPETKKKQSAGVLIVEDDGRIWMYEPANHFGGYSTTFSKGRVDEGDTMQQAALREMFEELGLTAEITGFLGDYEGSVTNTRMYVGKRTGGAPWLHDNEVAEVRLVSAQTAGELLHVERDLQILADLTGDDTALVALQAKEAERKAKREAEWAARPKSKWSNKAEWKAPQGKSEALSLTEKYMKLGGDTTAEYDNSLPPPDTVVPMTTAELGVSNADFQLNFLRARMAYQKTLQANSVSNKQRTLNDLLESEMSNVGGDGMPTDFMYDVEAASTAVGKALDDEIERRVLVFAGDQLLTKDEFDASYSSLKAEHTVFAGKILERTKVVNALMAEDPEAYAGKKVTDDPEVASLIEQMLANEQRLKRLDRNRQLHRESYARFAKEVLSEVVDGGIGGKVNMLVFNPDPASVKVNVIDIINGIAPQKKLSPDEESHFLERVQETVGAVYPAAWLAASNAFKTPVSAGLDPHRSWYDFSHGYMRLPSNVDDPYFTQVAIHEFGHRMEHVIPAIRRLEFAFYWRRMGKKKVPTQKLNDLVGEGKKPYGENETARPDEFSTPYMGKDYGGSDMSFWELFTMGTERLLAEQVQKATQGANGLMANDPDYRAWTLGVLVNATPPGAVV